VGIVGFVLNSLLSAILIGCCTWPLYVILLVYYGIKAYQGEAIQIPLITDWVKNQGWSQIKYWGNPS
jgi:uncharacterized membrane protein